MNRISIGLMVVLCLLCSSCIKNSPDVSTTTFEEQELDAVLAIVIDMSGSYSEMWEDKAYQLFLEISDRYFQGAMGTETRLLIGQLSGNDNVLLFEGKPSDLRKKFRSPAEFTEFLKAAADPNSSRVYAATRRTLDYVSTISGVGPKTKLLTVLLSDMQDSEFHPSVAGVALDQLNESLQRYADRGGSLALYYVDESERSRWDTLLRNAGFMTGRFIIEGSLTSSPRLPSFE
ncbi:hypothetical protein [Planctomicrobium sp. SH664]|uniref:hypothetical protein n=1 Tax=Planctomicrobium sp. SH664 TaxID=3448125 RepID=UPI003F5B3893